MVVANARNHGIRYVIAKLKNVPFPSPQQMKSAWRDWVPPEQEPETEPKLKAKPKFTERTLIDLLKELHPDAA